MKKCDRNIPVVYRIFFSRTQENLSNLDHLQAFAQNQGLLEGHIIIIDRLRQWGTTLDQRFRRFSSRYWRGR